MVLELADAAPLSNLDGHCARNDVTRGEILGRGRIALHEALAFGIDEVGALPARAFGDQAARAVNTGGMELHEFHVLQRQPRPQHHGVAVPGTGVRGGTREVGAPIAASGKNRHVRAEPMDRSIVEFDGNNAAAAALFVHD